MKWWLRWRFRVWERRALIARGRMEIVYRDSAEFQTHLNEYAAAITEMDNIRRRLDG